MNPSVCVFGLWHLGCVTAACLAAQGHTVVGLDLDAQRITDLNAGRVPVAEPGLADLVAQGLREGRLSFTSDPNQALPGAEVLWVTFDTPVDEDDHGDPEWVRAQLERIRSAVQPHTLVLVSSQVPVGFGRALEADWRSSEPSLEFATSPENLRLGTALRSFSSPERVVVGLGKTARRDRLQRLFGPQAERIEWMSMESAEMTKHALNGFLALSVAYTNEIARICERLGADAAEVERGLRTEPRIGQNAYVTAGAPIAGGTLARDVAFLNQLSTKNGLVSPVLRGIQDSNALHVDWIRERIHELLEGIGTPRVALLGLTYKAGTDTLRRSAALELGRWLFETGVDVRAYDPAIQKVGPEISWLGLARGATEALAGADVAVLATPWPAFKEIDADQLVSSMRHARFIDQAGFLPHLGDDPRIQYIRVGRSRKALV